MCECLDYDDGTRHTCEACAGDLEMLRDALARSESARREAEENLATATWTPSDDRVMELLVAEQELASERAARERAERENLELASLAATNRAKQLAAESSLSRAVEALQEEAEWLTDMAERTQHLVMPSSCRERAASIRAVLAEVGK